ncbi:amino acid adenylation domain-containing protein [Nocardia sp. CDC159]|uniref:Amino acid adenylation domain-containing protein n=1 Tax=Nocardia pulmonis TaxID=2951408 RepID=A0A9X2E4B9_9NOCA|nr:MULTISPECIES: non-ribosomal peptide synthetase [Nocardia]MCM6772590.1 amino acid adenylation domain-containing protein [Nocardia pulmonis]MCM6784752.1 amino acid adenylation domain-containing protein [Nocardia sp. CDC159]
MDQHRFPLTDYQRDIWSQAALFPGVGAYNSVNSLRIAGEVDRQIMGECIRGLFIRHDGLRLRFGSENGIPFQWVDEEFPELQYLDMSGESDPRSACLTWMERTAARPVDYADGGPLTTVWLVRESDRYHYLFIKSHHLVADGMALTTFLPQLHLDYVARASTGRPAELPGSSYRRFAEEIGHYPGSEPWREDLRFFRDRLAGYRPVDADRAAVPQDGTRLEHYSFALDRDLVTRLRDRPTSLYSQFLAAVAIYLGRLRRTDDLVLGIPFANRQSEAEWSTIGTFANALPLRIALDERVTLGELSHRIQDEIQAMKAHERISLGSLLHHLTDAAGPRQLFDVAVSKVRLPQAGVSGRTDEYRIYPAGHSLIGLQMYLREYGRGDITVEFDYYSDVFDDEQPVQTVGRRLVHLLTMIVEHPDRELRRVDLLFPEEKAAIARWNATARPYDRTLTLGEAFVRQARRTPDAVAVVSTRTLSYGELDAESDALAAVLRSRGVRRGDRVAVLLERGPELLVAIFAALKCGAAYVPIDPNYPPRRVEYLLSDSAATAVLARRDLPLVAVRPELPFVFVDDPLPRSTPVVPTTTGDDLAYVIYTSGSTGRPKGVMVEHHSVINRLSWMQRAYPLDARDVVLQKTPISFDVSVWELFWWALAGARVALLTPGAERDPAELLDAIAAQGVTVMHFVPSMLEPFLDLLEREPARLSQTASLRVVFSSGEALRRGLVDRFNRIFARAGHRTVRLVNLYGPTEATVDITCYETPADPAVPTARVPIGWPIDNIELHVLGPADLEQPIGMPGELIVVGAGVARGYLDRPALTAEKFHADPFDAEGGRVYRTGDLVRRLADGSIEYLGRIDGQVKVRGNRVELGEVEDALVSLDAVRGAAATVIDDPVRGSQLVAFYVADDRLDPRQLRAHLATVLPQFMIPARFERIDRIPLSPSGKTDRKALPAPIGAGSVDATRDGVAAGTETVLAEVFSTVLGVDAVRADDDFYVLGGDSLLVLQVCALAGQRGVRITPRDVVTHPTVAQLARVAGQGGPADDAVAPFALVTDRDRARLWFAADAYPLARLQSGMLYHSIESESATLYHDVFEYTMRMPWDEQAWLRAATRLVERHPALRTSFDISGYSEPLQIVHREVPAAVTVTDLSGVAPESAAAEIADYVDRRRRHPYRLDAAPLYAIRVFRLRDTVKLVFSFHHAILDGWSVAMLISQLLGDYLSESGHRVERDAEPTDLPTYAEFVRAERQALADPRMRQFWADELADSAVTRIWPQDRDGVAERVSHTLAVPQSVAAAARALAAAQRVPVSTVLFTAHCLALQALSGSRRVTTGVVTHNRPARLGAERVAGLFLNTMPVRVDLPEPGPSGRDILTMVRARELALDAYRGYPLAAIEHEHGSPVIATAFNYVDFHIAESLLSATDLDILDVRFNEQTNFPLMVNVGVSPVDKTMFVRVDGDGIHVAEAMAEAFAHTYLDILQRLSGDSEQPVDLASLTTLPVAAPAPVTVVDTGSRQVIGTPAPADAEDVLAQVFSEVLGVAEVGVHDDFYVLGGDSLLVLKACALAGRRGLRITARDVATHPTVARLARVARPGDASDAGVAPFALLTEADRARLESAADAYPLAQLQWGMLYHSIESESSTLYHDVFRYTLGLPWDEQAWLRAGARLTQRHPALRTSFNVNGFSEPLQIVYPEVPLACTVTDLSAADAETAAAQVADYERDRRRYAYRLDAAPLWALRVFRLPDTVELVFSFHHAILDGWSVAMLISQLLADYLRETGHRVDWEIETANLPSYAEFVRAERRALADADMRRFWAEELHDAQATTLDGSVPSGNDETGERLSRTVPVPLAVARAAREFAAAERFPVSTVVFTAHCLALRACTGAAHLTTGVVTHNRPARLGAEQVAGLFLNTVPVRLDLSQPGRSGREIVAAVRAQEIRLDPYRIYPLSAIQREHGSPVLATAFNYVNFHVAEPLLADSEIEVLDVAVAEQTNFQLMVTVAVDPVDESWTLRIDGDAAHLTESAADEFARAYLDVLDVLCSRPERPADRISARRPRPRPTPPAREGGAPARRVPDTAAVVHAEEVLAQVFSEVLGVDRIGVHDDFYVLGGDSLLVLKVCGLAGRRGLQITARDVATHPTVGELARIARQGTASQESTAPFALVTGIDRARLGDVDDAYPLAQLQWGMLYHSIESESSTLYHDVFRYILRLPWDEHAWLRAGAALVRRHPALRTSFDVSGFSEPLQIVHREVRLPFATTDVSALAPETAAARVDDYIRQRRGFGYRFDQAPLFEVHVFRLPDTVEVIVSFHHAILDGWSVALLISQLLQGYLNETGRLALPGDNDERDLPTFADFVRAERQALASSQMRRFWQEALRDAEPTALGAIGLADTDGGARITHRVWIPAAVTEACRVLAAQQRVPIRTILFAVHCLTLHLFSGAPRVTTGLVTHNRPARFGADQVAGLFLNTIPVPVDLSDPNRTWRGVVDTVRAKELELDPYRAYPLSAIQHDRGDTDVIVTAFNFANFHIAGAVAKAPDIEFFDLRVEEQTNFSLLLNIYENPLNKSLSIHIDGDGIHVDAPLAEAFAHAYLTILRTAVTHPDDAIDFAALRPSQPLTRPRSGAPMHVVDAVQTQACRTPDAPAVIHGTRRVSYRELWQRAQGIALALSDRGIGPGARIGVALSQRPERIAAVLGIAAAGAAVVPLDTGQPAVRLRGMIEDAAPALIVIDGDPIEAIPAERAVRIGELLDGSGGRRAPGAPRRLEQTAYVLFTSGSTGRPKAVTMPHRGLANLVAWQLSTPSGRIGERAPHTVQLAPLTFDVAFQEIFATLCGGGTLQLAEEELRTDARALVRLLDAASVERVFLPYVALQQLAQVAVETGRYPRHLSRVVSSGEQLRITAQIKDFLAALPELLLVENQYGPTETHVATYHSLTAQPREFPLLPPIGVPIGGAEVHVLDARLCPVPERALGEIYLGGACLADGYEHRPGLTAQRFVADPQGDAGSRLYRTGDLGRRQPGGIVVCEGRADDQVKVRGFRVEPAEVEAAILAAVPAVREAAVLARTGSGSSADTVLAAYLVGDPAAAEIDDIRRRVAAVVPGYEVPAHVEWVDAIPRTPSGKRADAVLRGLPLHPATRTTTAVSPRDELEGELVDLVADILGTDTIGIEDSFFDLGGTSLSATRLVLAVERRYGTEVSMSAFTAAPTVAALADLLRGTSEGATSDPLVAIKPSGDKSPLFLVHPLGGTVSCYLPLARHLPADQPLYGLQAAGIDAGTTPLHTIPDIAASYLGAIRRVQPEGPYRIGGWSLGGLIAFEMLRQLEAVGQQVATVVLLDAMIGRVDAPADTLGLATHQLFLWELLRGDRAVEAPVPAIPATLRTDDEVLQFILDQAVAEGVVPQGSSLGLIRRLFAVFRATWQATVDYRPQRTDHDLTLLRAAEPLPEILRPVHDGVGSRYGDATNGWDALTTGKIDVVSVPGNHLTLMDEPFVGQVAETLTKVLHLDDQAERIMR